MKNLFLFLWKYNFFLLFLLLEGIGLSIVLNQNHYHHSKIFNSANSTSGYILQTYNSGEEYFQLKKINQLLIEDNARLLAKQKNAYMVFFKDTIFLNARNSEQRFEFISAKVIGSSVNKYNNYITIDKGREDGIEINFAAISSFGVVGKVIGVSENFSIISSVLNHHLNISGKIQKSNNIGTIKWDGKDYRYCKLQDIPTYVKLSKGDTIITSGYSYVFPEGVLIGTIKEYNIFRGSSFYDITIELSTNFNTLQYVYIAKDLYKNEIDSLLTDKTTDE